MSLTIQTARKWIARQIGRWHTLQRALHKDHEEDRYRVIRAVVSRLQIADSTKQRILSWSLSRILDQQQRSLRSQMLRAQSEWDAKGQKRLNQLLASDETVEIPASGTPKVSFVLVTYNKDHLTVLSLESVMLFADLPYELIVVDNGSTDSTLGLLDRIKGAKIIRNQANLGFGPACMQAADLANGEYLCFFNNDALLTKGALSAALKNFNNEGVGAVGGKIFLANGKLQEAGSIVWSDGSVLGYGRGDDPDSPQYNVRRPLTTVQRCF